MYFSKGKSASERKKGYIVCKMQRTRGVKKPCVFECPPALQVWTLLKVSSNPYIFSFQSLFVNLNYLYWRVYPHMDEHQFAWDL